MTLSQKTKPTNRKFYGKWLYKVTLRLEGCFLFRNKSIAEIQNFCNEKDPKELRYSIWNKAYNNREQILDVCALLETFDKTAYSTRIENNFIDFYSNNETLYNQLSIKFENILKHRFEPDKETVDMLSDSKHCISVKKLPKGRYNYRVYLLPHKMSGDKEGKQKYISWLKSQNSKITCTEAVEKWFMHTDWNWDRRYVLVEDEQTLLMMKLRNSEVVGRIYNFIISDK